MREKKMINIEIGERIKAAREHATLTQERFSEKIEVSPQYISDVERGVVGVSLSTLKRICTVLGVSADTLLFGDRPTDRYEMLTTKCCSLTDEQFCLLTTIITAYTDALHTVETGEA